MNLFFTKGHPNSKGIKYFDLLFWNNHSLTKPNICAKLRDIGALSCITSCPIFSWTHFY